MLTCLQAEQQDLNKHAYAPQRRLIAALNAATEGESNFLGDAFKRQIFNWLPVPPTFDFKKLRKVQIESRTDCGLLWNCIMMDQTTLAMNPTWDDAQLSKREIEEMVGQILRVSREFATMGNWEKTVGVWLESEERKMLFDYAVSFMQFPILSRCPRNAFS